jgi:hypothetical protein
MPTTKPVWTTRGSNSGLGGEKSATNTAYELFYTQSGITSTRRVTRDINGIVSKLYIVTDNVIK